MHRHIGLSAAIGARSMKSMACLKVMVSTALRQLIITRPTNPNCKPEFLSHEQCSIGNKFTAMLLISYVYGRPHIGANGVSWPPGQMDENVKCQNMQKRQSFLNVGGGEGRYRERRYADHIFIQMHFRMHHFVAKFSKFSLPRAARGHWPL